MNIIDGKKIAQNIKKDFLREVLSMKKDNIQPSLSVILVGNDPASNIYVRNKEQSCQELGIISTMYRLAEKTTEADLLNLIKKLNNNEKIHGILIQLPLPSHINEENIIESINPKKDVDCFHPRNIGKVIIGESDFYPCTPLGILEILKIYGVKIAGSACVIVGSSNIIGKPLAIMLSNLEATVTLCNNKTKQLKEECLKADILISATGKAKLITRDMVKLGAIVIDVGMNRDENGKLVGDVDFQKVSKVAKAITPVPGGVGPMTIAMLMKNTLIATRLLTKK